MAENKLSAPTATELLNCAIVREGIEQAWHDSQPDDPNARHEEGGWIYMDVATGEITVRRAGRGEQATIDLSQPPLIAGSVVVGKFRTHPNPTYAGWEPGPSDTDQAIDAIHGVPDLIEADNGTYFSGPDQRRGGLAGAAGYPA